jgi:hypothetical protein
VRLLLVAEQLRRQAPDGISTYIRGLVRGLEALPSGPHVTLWASRPPSQSGPDPVAALGHDTLTSLLPRKALVWAWDRGWVSPWSAAPDGFDVVHATSLAVPPPGPTPLAVTVHDLVWRRVRNRPAYLFEPLGERQLKGIEPMALFRLVSIGSSAPADRKSVV